MLCRTLTIDLHIASTEQTKERAVSGRTTGFIEMGEGVTWEATHFGVRQKLTSKIVAFDSPKHFRDSMVSGAFARFDHDHYFIAEKEGTLMRDVFNYTSPYGLLGSLADTLFLRKYMVKLLEKRNSLSKWLNLIRIYS